MCLPPLENRIGDKQVWGWFHWCRLDFHNAARTTIKEKLLCRHLGLFYLHFRYLSRLLQRAALAEDTDFITGEGLPNPNPVVVPNWGELLLAGTGGPQPVSILTRPTVTSGLTSAAVLPVSAVVCR